jgi:hypothetical protein
MDILEELGYSRMRMFKKLIFKGLNYKDLDRYESHDLKRDEMHSFYQTFDFLDLITLWPKIVGEKQAKSTAPLKIKNDNLVIVVMHPAQADQLSYLSEHIKTEIFKVLPKLKPIIKRLSYITQEGFFEQKRVTLATPETLSQKIHPQSPQFKIFKQEAERLFSDIEDPELKQIMVSIYIQSRG